MTEVKTESVLPKVETDTPMPKVKKPKTMKSKAKREAVQKKSKSKVEKINIKYFNDNLKKIEKISIGDWIDLRSSIDVHLPPDTFKLIPLGVAMQLPEGYEAHIVPRSSTFKKFKVIQTNSKGVIDNSYRGDKDQWYFPARTLTGSSTIRLNDRICQFRIVPVQPKIEFVEKEIFNTKSRGGFGSTGIK